VTGYTYTYIHLFTLLLTGKIKEGFIVNVIQVQEPELVMFNDLQIDLPISGTKFI